MARKHPSRSTPPLPVTLPGYPSCENCLAWSNEGLAVACGENVHMLTFTSTVSNLTNATSQQVTVHTVRVNLFDNKEWPPEELTSCNSLSLGEEQSDSVVVGIAWSSSGLGVYRRNVLAVLTSNLRLCLWETDGTPGWWRRTCVLNHFIQAEGASRRRRNQVRCFAWTPTLHISQNDRWGVQFLVIADGFNTLHMYRVSKNNRLALGDWQFEEVWQHDLSVDDPGQALSHDLTTLQHALTVGRTVANIVVGPWELSRHDSIYVATLTCAWSYSMPPSAVVVELKAADFTAHQNATEPLSQLLHSEHETKPPYSMDLLEMPRVLHTLESFPSWKKSLHDICQKYDHQHNLNGKYRVQFWGIAKLSHLEAVCFTLHPSDMYEYTTAVIQKCKVVFQTIGTAQNGNATSDLAPEGAVRNDILQVGIQLSINPEMITAGMDEKIVKNFKSIAAKWKGEESVVRQKASQRSSKVVLDASAEVCGLCQAEIPLTTDFSAARCGRGHRYSRCNLSTLAIQEPGISKYCSLCNKEYLDHGRLSLLPEPCLTRALFDTFDVCPFCDGKYRS